MSNPLNTMIYRARVSFLPFIVAIVALVWSPHGLQAQTPSTPPSAETAATTAKPTIKLDPVALAIVKKSDAATRALKTYQADWWRTSTGGDKTTYSLERIIGAKPNKMRFDSWESSSPTQTAATAEKLKKTPSLLTLVNDGKTRWQQWKNTYTSTSETGPPQFAPDPLVSFFNNQGLIQDQIDRANKNGKQSVELRTLPAEKKTGVLCDKVLFVSTTADKATPRQFEYRTVYYFGRADGLLRHIEHEASSSSTDESFRMRSVTTVQRLVANAPITNSKTTFAYAPPKGVTKEKPAEYKSTPLLANGTIAPDFTATDKDSKEVKLSDFKGKVVILDFWASWCGPCVASMPHNQRITKKLQAESLPVVLLAVDNSEGQAAFAKWVGEHKELDALTFVYADRGKADIAGALYKVTGIPTQYVIDANGIIRASSVGFGGENDTLEKSIRAALEQK